MESNEMTPIEQKEIRGLSVKTLITIVACTISMVGTTLGTYFGLQNDIRQLRIEKQGDDKYNDLRIRTIEVRQSALELQIKELQSKQEGLIKQATPAQTR